MVDSNDRDRVVEARDELHRMLNEVLEHKFSYCWSCDSNEHDCGIMKSCTLEGVSC